MFEYKVKLKKKNLSKLTTKAHLIRKSYTKKKTEKKLQNLRQWINHTLEVNIKKLHKNVFFS